MSLFSPPPPSSWSQGPVNSTPPIPHSPIPAQGDLPPRRQTAAAMMMVAVLSSWPQDLEPRLHPHNQTQKTKIAPLTLTYGQQPPRVSFLTAPEYQTILTSWPWTDAPLPPRGQSTSWFPSVITFVPGAPAWRIHPAIVHTHQAEAAYEVELVSTFVVAPENPDRPPIAGPGRLLPILLASWQPADPAPVQRLTSIVPRLAAVVQPIPQGPLSVPELVQVVASWPATLEPRLSRPNDQQQKIAPLTLTYGTSPQPQPALSIPELTQIVATWAESWGAQTAPKSASWNVPPVLISLPYTPLPRSLWTAWEPPFVAPPVPVHIAPLTLPTGVQPIPQGPIAFAELGPILTAWPQTWDAQSAPKSAAWNVPPLVAGYLPPARFPHAIYTAWQPPDPLPVLRLVSIVPILPAVSQPPRRAALTIAQLIAVTSWPADLEPRLLWPNASRIQIAPLTLVYGQAPPPRPALLRANSLAHAQWPLDLEPRLTWPNAARIRQIPLPPTTVPAALSDYFIVDAVGRWFLVDAEGRWFLVDV